MKTTTSRLRLLALALCLAAGTLTCPADETFDRLVARWKTDREQLMRRMTQAWLRGERPENLKSELMALSQMESGLATKPGVTLYMGAVDNPGDLNAAVGSVVRAYLKARRVEVQPADFFRGQTFSVLREEEPVAPANTGSKQNESAKKPAGEAKGSTSKTAARK